VTISDAVWWGQQALMTVAMIGGPILVVALVVGASVGLLQAVTQVHEMTLVFVPKIIAVCLVLALMGGWMLERAVNFGVWSFSSIESIE